MQRVGKMAVVVLVLLCSAFAAPALAQTTGQDAGPITNIPEIDQALGAAGLGLLVMVIVEILKRLLVIPDGQAGIWATILGVLGYLVILVLGYFRIDLTQGPAQDVVALFIKLGEMALALITALGGFGLLRKANVLPPMASRQ